MTNKNKKSRNSFESWKERKSTVYAIHGFDFQHSFGCTFSDGGKNSWDELKGEVNGDSIELHAEKRPGFEHSAMICAYKNGAEIFFLEVRGSLAFARFVGYSALRQYIHGEYFIKKSKHKTAKVADEDSDDSFNVPPNKEC